MTSCGSGGVDFSPSTLGPGRGRARRRPPPRASEMQRSGCGPARRGPPPSPHATDGGATTTHCAVCRGLCGAELCSALVAHRAFAHSEALRHFGLELERFRSQKQKGFTGRPGSVLLEYSWHIHGIYLVYAIFESNASFRLI